MLFWRLMTLLRWGFWAQAPKTNEFEKWLEDWCAKKNNKNKSECVLFVGTHRLQYDLSALRTIETAIRTGVVEGPLTIVDVPGDIEDRVPTVLYKQKFFLGSDTIELFFNRG